MVKLRFPGILENRTGFKNKVPACFFLLKLEGYSYLQKTIFKGFQLSNFPGLS